MNLLEIMPLEIKIKGGGPKFTEFACSALVPQTLCCLVCVENFLLISALS